MIEENPVGYGTLSKNDNGTENNNSKSNTSSPSTSHPNSLDQPSERNIIIFGRDLNMTFNELLAVSMLSVYFFLTWSYFSLFTPFFPEEAIRKKMNRSQIGIIFGILQLVLLIFSPLFGKYLNKIGIKFLFVSGILLGAGSEIAFGFMDMTPEGTVYFIMCLVCRGVSGFGASMGLSYAIVGYFFPNKIASVVALLEVCTGIGLMTGPVLGGFLYQIGGFRLPFFFMGAVQLILFVVAFLFFPNPKKTTVDEPNVNENGSKPVDTLPMMPLLKIPQFSLTLLMLFCGCVSINFVEPNIQLHLIPLGLEPVELGFVFFIPALIYVIVTPFVGFLCDKYPKSQPWFMIISAFFSMIAYSLLGPLPFFNMPLKLSTFLTGFIIFAISYTGLIIPVYSELNKIARSAGYPNDLRTQGLISGLFGAIHSLGALIGPMVGGFLVDWIGFNQATFIIVIMFFVVGVMYGVCYAFNIICLKNSDNPNSFEENNETRPLVT